LRITKARVTPGAYVQYGRYGTRVGQSKCVEKRVLRSAKENASCLGEIMSVQVFPAASAAKRRALEKSLIDLFGTTESCNLIRA